MTLTKRAAAEFFGTFWLVFGGCGSAVLAAAFPGLGIGFGGRSRVRPNCADYGLRHRTHFRMSFESSNLGRTGCRQAVPRVGPFALYNRASPGRCLRGGRS